MGNGDLEECDVGQSSKPRGVGALGEQCRGN